MASSSPRIKKVVRISSFGLFRSFVAAAPLPDFDRYNLIYGWNYSGKTTLARLFQSIEHSRPCPDFPTAAFNLELTDGSLLTNTPRPPPIEIRVFNRDFIEANFHQGSDMTGVPAIAVIGAENKALKDRFELLSRRAERVRGILERLRSNAAVIQNRLDEAGTNSARTVDRIFGERFRRDHLLRIVEALPDDESSRILDEDALDGRIDEWRNAQRYGKLRILEPSHSSFVRSIPRMRRVLKGVASNRAIERLRANASIESWVDKGMELNSAGTRCEFCGNVVAQERWEELRAHFSEEFRALQREVQKLFEEYSAFDGIPATAERRDVLPEFHARFDQVVEELQCAMTAVMDEVTSIKARIQDKLQNLEAPADVNGSLHHANRSLKNAEIR